MASPLATYFRRQGRGARTRLAKAVGVSEPTISRYVTGERKPELPRALAIEAATDGAVPASAWRHLRTLLAQLSSRSA